MMRARLPLLACLLLAACRLLAAQTGASQTLPDPRQLMREVEQHQRELDKVRENYTFTSIETTQTIDGSGQAVKTESVELEVFFVNSHPITRTVKKDGKALEGRDERKESERVAKMVEKSGKTPPGQQLDAQTVSISRLLDLMEVRNPRRESFRGRPTIVFDFAGRRDAKTHGLAEDLSKKLRGAIWIDEQDRQVAHLDVAFNDNFRIAGGLVATIQKGSSFSFDQALVNGELWLPVAGEGQIQAKVLMMKNLREHFSERDYDYKRFGVDAQQGKDLRPVGEKAK